MKSKEDWQNVSAFVLPGLPVRVLQLNTNPITEDARTLLRGAAKIIKRVGWDKTHPAAVTTINYLSLTDDDLQIASNLALATRIMDLNIWDWVEEDSRFQAMNNRYDTLAVEKGDRARVLDQRGQQTPEKVSPPLLMRLMEQSRNRAEFYLAVLDYSKAHPQKQWLSLQQKQTVSEGAEIEVHFLSASVTQMRLVQADYQDAPSWVDSIASAQDRLSQRLQPYLVRSEVRRTASVQSSQPKAKDTARRSANAQQETGPAERLEVVRKTALSLLPLEAGESAASLRLSAADLNVLIRAYQKTGDPNSFESQLALHIDLVKREVFETLITQLDQRTKDITLSYAVGIVIPEGLEAGVLEAFMEGYIDALKHAPDGEVLVEGSSRGEVTESMRAAGLKVRNLNTRQPAPVLSGDEQNVIPVAQLDAQTTTMIPDYLGLGVDLTAVSLRPFENDREMLKLFGRYTATAQRILADLSKGEKGAKKLTRPALKAALLKKLFASEITQADLIQMTGQGSTAAFKINLGLIAGIVNQMLARRAAERAA